MPKSAIVETIALYVMYNDDDEISESHRAPHSEKKYGNFDKLKVQTNRL
jgi:hypothetical protein